MRGGGGGGGGILSGSAVAGCAPLLLCNGQDEMAAATTTAVTVAPTSFTDATLQLLPPAATMAIVVQLICFARSLPSPNTHLAKLAYLTAFWAVYIAAGPFLFHLDPWPSQPPLPAPPPIINIAATTNTSATASVTTTAMLFITALVLPSLLRGAQVAIQTQDDTLSAVQHELEVMDVAQELTHAGSWESCLDPDTGERCIRGSNEWFRIYGHDPEYDDENPNCDASIQRKRRSPKSRRRRPIPNTMLHARFMSMIVEADRARVRQCGAAMATGTMEPEELTFRINRASDGVEINVQTYIYPIRNATGTVVGVCGAAQDITSQVSGERALLQAKDEAAKESAQFFLATMTHELRTPLTSIIGYIDLLDDTHLDTSQREYILDAKRGAKTLLALINNILDYSKLAAGAIELDTHAMQVSDLLSDVRAIAKDLGHGTTLVVGPYTGPPTVAADSLRIRQVLLNLVSNAMKFTAPDGNVDITTAWESDKSDDSVFLEFTVKDSGIGMSKEVMARLFHPFVQAAPSTSRHYGGTGLGLSIVKRLVEAMKGTLSVHSIEGTGTTFTVRIPARIISMSMLFSGASSATLTSNGGHTPPSSELHNSPFAMNHQPTSPPHTPPPSRPSVDPEIAATTRILFAEDNPITQTLVKRMLKPLRVETAVNGAIAIDMVAAAVAADEPYTVLLCDLNMAIMDGIDTAREIRRRYHRKPNTSSSSSSSSDSKNTSSNSTGTIHTNTVMYIVGLSASAFTQDRDRCLDAGMDAFLSKPFTKQGLLAAVATAIASQRCSAP